MIQPDETFDGSFPFAPHFTQAPGFAMHYVDEGPRDGEVLLCLHGEPTWGYLFRHLIAALKATHRVVVPDHMGFGKSATPPGRTYWLKDHIDNLEHLVLALDLRGITLVLHDFGGPAGMGLAARHPDRIRRVVSVNGPTPFGQASAADRLMENAREAPWFQWILRAEAEGRLDGVLGELGYNILSTLKLNGFEDNALIDDAWLRAYGSPFPTPADCAGAIGWAKGFALGLHQVEVPDERALGLIRALPAMAIWGMADRTLHARHFLPLFEELFPDAPMHRLDGVGHYSFEDAPAAISRLIATFLQES